MRLKRRDKSFQYDRPGTPVRSLQTVAKPAFEWPVAESRWPPQSSAHTSITLSRACRGTAFGTLIGTCWPHQLPPRKLMTCLTRVYSSIAKTDVSFP